jgi:hypothetical protein
MTERQRNAAKAIKVKVKHGRHVYEVDPTDMTWELLEADARGAYSAVVEGLLGPEQFAEFKKRNPKPLVNQGGNLVSVVNDLRDSILVELGNYAASSS